MHLAGALNIKTVSFFGSGLFASPKRWATVSDVTNQNNLIIKDYQCNSVVAIIEGIINV
jgi:ADP-heptose:LPS heptosyltransferase